MLAIRKELHEYIDRIPVQELQAVKPILALLVREPEYLIESDLTQEELELIREGEEEYAKGHYVSLENILAE